MAGRVGARGRGGGCPRRPEGAPPRLFARDASTSARAIRRLCRIGTSDRLSAPPAMPGLGVAQADGVRHLRDGLVGRGAGPVHGEAGDARGQAGPQRGLAAQVGGLHRRDDLAHHHGADPGRVGLGALEQLAHAGRGQVEGGQVAERRCPPWRTASDSQPARRPCCRGSFQWTSGRGDFRLRAARSLRDRAAGFQDVALRPPGHLPTIRERPRPSKAATPVRARVVDFAPRTRLPYGCDRCGTLRQDPHAAVLLLRHGPGGPCHRVLGHLEEDQKRRDAEALRAEARGAF